LPPARPSRQSRPRASPLNPTPQTPAESGEASAAPGPAATPGAQTTESLAGRLLKKKEEPARAPALDLKQHEEDWATRRSNHSREIMRVRKWLFWSNFLTLILAAAVPVLEFVLFYDKARSETVRFGGAVAGSALVIFAVGLVALLKAGEPGGQWLALHVVLGAVLGAANAAYGIHRFELAELKCALQLLDADVCDWIDGGVGQLVSSLTAVATVIGLLVPVCCSLVLLVRKESLAQIKVQTLEVTDAVLRLEYHALRTGQPRLMNHANILKLADRVEALDLRHLAGVVRSTNDLHQNKLLVLEGGAPVARAPTRTRTAAKTPTAKGAAAAPTQRNSTAQGQGSAAPAAAAPAAGAGGEYDDQQGYYDENGQWVNYADQGYYDENGQWVEYDQNAYNGYDQSYDQYY